jgi:hypothetical protein
MTSGRLGMIALSEYNSNEVHRQGDDVPASATRGQGRGGRPATCDPRPPRGLRVPHACGERYPTKNASLHLIAIAVAGRGGSSVCKRHKGEYKERETWREEDGV